jgi:Ca2+-binding EF-hand superfamily protein
MSMKEELMESFRVFDPERNGFMPVSEFRYYLRTYGIAMPEEEVEELIKESEPEEGYVKYEKFVDKLLNQA